MNLKDKNLLSIICIAFLFICMSQIVLSVDIDGDADTVNATYLYQNDSLVWDVSNVANVTNGDNSHLVLADDIYDWVFSNPFNWITNAVNDLTNYYLKTETYNKSEVNTNFVNVSGDTITGDLNVTGNITADYYYVGSNRLNSSQIPDHDGHSIKSTFEHIINRGKASEITITKTGGLGINWTAGELYDSNAETFFTTDAGSGTLTNHAVNYLKWVSGTTLTISTTAPSGDEILIATFSVYDGVISGYRETALLDESHADTRRGLRALFPTRIISGMSVHEDTDVTNPLDVTMDAGVLYKEAIEKKTPGEIKSRNTAMVRHFHTAGVWDSDTNAQIETTNYDNGNDLTAIPNNKYVKGLFIYMSGKIGFVYPTEYYNTIAQAQNAPLPAMPTGLESVPKLTAVIYQQGVTDFTNAIWQDVRAGISEQSFSVVTDHGALAGLSDDDHPQYALLSGRDANSLAIDEIKAYDAAGLKLYDDGGNGIFVKDGGNVGIGTTTPGSKLSIDAAKRQHIFFESSVETSQNKIAGFFSAKDMRWEIGPTNKETGDLGPKLLIIGKDYPEYSDYQPDSIALVAGDARRLVVNSNGNVGIGTTTPDTPLHIYDSSATADLYIESGGSGLGGRIILEDEGGGTCTAITTLNGTLTAEVVTCP